MSEHNRSELPFNPEMLAFMAAYYDQYGFPPNMREIEGEPTCGVYGTSTVMYQLRVMGSQGYVHQPHPVRGIWTLTTRGWEYVKAHTPESETR